MYFSAFLVHGVEQYGVQGGVTYQQSPQLQSQQHQYHQQQIQYQQTDISPPVFEKIFKNARFAQGGNALFDGRLKGNPKPVVSWTRKGAPLLESNKFRMAYNEATGDVSLLINQIGPGDEGEYTCTARNQFGEAICSVYIQPEGHPMPQIQNMHKQYELNQQSQSNYSNGYSLTSIHEEFKVDTFEYRILREVSFRESLTRRNFGEHDSQLTFEVDRNLGPAAPPQISQKPRNSKLIEGSDAVFSAQVGANPQPRLTWFKDGQRISSSAKFDINYSSNQASLKVRNANASDSGHYTLLAENPQGCVVSSAVLAIEAAQETPVSEYRQPDLQAQPAEQAKALAPAFIRGFNDRDVTEGKMTKFECRITGRPYPEVFWFINDRQVQDDATHKILVNESGNHSLMITQVNRYDAGVITCVARNKAGEIAHQARLGVLEKEQVVAPKFIERFGTVNVREGEPVLLTARAIGTPVPRITWQKDGSSNIQNPSVSIAIDEGATSLDIPRAKASDAGWYQCTAQNVVGSTATRARLFVETPQDPVPEQRRLYFPRPTKFIEPE